MSAETLYRKITDMINRHEAKGVDREDMYVVIQPQDLKQISEMVERNMADLDKINGAKIWATNRTNYCEPYILDVNVISEIASKKIRGIYDEP